MSSQSQPQSPAVYRRRRLLAFAVLVLVIAIVIAIVNAVVGGSSADNSASATPTPTAVASIASASASVPVSASASASASASSSASASPSASAIAQECTAKMVKVTPATSKTKYAEDEDPVFVMKIKNTSASACVMQVALSDLHFVVVKGDKVVWRMEDCLSGGSESTLALQPGTTQKASYTWHRITSDDGHCNTGEDDLVTAPKDLALSVSVNGISSLQLAKFKLTK